MKRKSTRAVELIDFPSLALPEQQELARSLKELLIQAARQAQQIASDPAQEDVHEARRMGKQKGPYRGGGTLDDK